MSVGVVVVAVMVVTGVGAASWAWAFERGRRVGDRQGFERGLDFGLRCGRGR